MRTRTSGAALCLLQALLEASPGGRVFTSAVAVSIGAELGISAGHIYKLLSELTDRGILQRPRGRLYVMQPPFGGISPVRPIAIAVRAVQPAAVSGDTALVHWDLIDQVPLHEEVVSTPARVQWTHGVRADAGDHLWTVEGTTIRFRHVLPREMFGITTERLDSETVVPIFDRERTILELLTPPAHANAAWAAELLRAHRHDLNIPRLKDYARRVDAAEQVTRALAAGARSVPVRAS